MPVFNFTAPTVTPEECQAEFDALSPDEKGRVRDDLFGSTAEEEQPTLSLDLALVHEALEGIVDKPEYDTALEAGLMHEAPVAAFLRHAQGDPWMAAERIVNYWKVRRRVFEERAYLPMTLDGAMADQVKYLKKAFILVLKDDVHGRAVLMWDRARLTAQVAPRQSVCRCVFYSFHCVQQVSDEWVGLQNMKGCDLYRNFDRILTKQLFGVVQCFPMTLKGYHMCTGSGRSVLELILPAMMHIVGREWRLRTVLHQGSDSEMLMSLEEYGLSSSHVDTVCKGPLHNVSLMEEWLRWRREYEQQQH